MPYSRSQVANLLKAAAVRAAWGGAVLFAALNVPFLGVFVLLLIYPVVYFFPAQLAQSGAHVTIWFGGIEFRSCMGAAAYWGACTLMAFALGLLRAPSEKRKQEPEKQ